MAKNRRKRCIHKYINIEFMKKKMKKENRIMSPIKDFFKNTFGVILENEENNESLVREVEEIKSTKLYEGEDFILKNKKVDKKSGGSSLTINRKNKIIIKNINEKDKQKKYDREIGE